MCSGSHSRLERPRVFIVCDHGVAIDSSAPGVGDSSLTQRCLDSHHLLVSELSSRHRNKYSRIPLLPRNVMARFSATADTTQGSHLWSTTPDIYQSDREENRGGRAEHHLARVMSPTHHLASSPPRAVSPTQQLALKSNDESRGSFDVAQVYCQDCNTLVSCLHVCT